MFKSLSWVQVLIVKCFLTLFFFVPAIAAPYFIISTEAIRVEFDYSTACERCRQENKPLCILLVRPRGICSHCDQVRTFYSGNDSPLNVCNSHLVFCCIEVSKERDSVSFQGKFLTHIIEKMGGNYLTLPCALIFNVAAEQMASELFALPRDAERFITHCQEVMMKPSDFPDELSRED